MIANLFTGLCRICPKLRGAMWKQWYQLLARVYQRKDWGFMNYGYAPLDDQAEPLQLQEADADNRYCIQLYHHVASAVDLHGLDVLEVGSGRGGGADYVKRYLEPEKMVGVDFSQNAVRFSSRTYAVDGLSFEPGNAESLPFADNSFDAVINVESSHCYGSMDAFLGQVRRVLRGGGHLLLADFRGEENIDAFRETLRKSGLTVVKETDITPNVVQALKLDSEHKTALIRKTVRWPLVKPFLEFAGIEGSKIYEEFKSGETIYLSFVLQKQIVSAP